MDLSPLLLFNYLCILPPLITKCFSDARRVRLVRHDQLALFVPAKCLFARQYAVTDLDEVRIMLTLVLMRQLAVSAVMDLFFIVVNLNPAVLLL